MQPLTIILLHQGNKVRQMKAGGTASKAEIAAEVGTLISLKGQLATAQGLDTAAAGGGDKDKKKSKKAGGGGGGKENLNPKPTSTGPAANATPTVTTPAAKTTVDEAEVSRLQALVTQQVRV